MLIGQGSVKNFLNFKCVLSRNMERLLFFVWKACLAYFSFHFLKTGNVNCPLSSSKDNLRSLLLGVMMGTDLT